MMSGSTSSGAGGSAGSGFGERRVADVSKAMECTAQALDRLRAELDGLHQPVSLQVDMQSSSVSDISVQGDEVVSVSSTMHSALRYHSTTSNDNHVTDRVFGSAHQHASFLAALRASGSDQDAASASSMSPVTETVLRTVLKGLSSDPIQSAPGSAVYFHRFRAGWIWATVCHYAVAALEREKRYLDAMWLLCVLLQLPYCTQRRGYWWTRLALNAEKHLAWHGMFALHEPLCSHAKQGTLSCLSYNYCSRLISRAQRKPCTYARAL